jgi:hypothetical protein
MTPKSDEAIAMLPQFVGEMEARMQAGKNEYGDSSFECELKRLVVEIQQELVDNANWSHILWTRMELLKRKIARIEALKCAAEPSSLSSSPTGPHGTGSA